MPSITIDLLRSVEWGKSYLWDFVIDDKDFPFDWVPAIDIEETSSIIDSEIITGGQTSFKIPKAAGIKEVKLTFIDDINHKVFSYFENWMDVITMKENMYIATLEECSKLIQIKRLDNDRQKTLKQSVYWVYPEGMLTYVANSDSDKLIYSISLVVVGSTSKSKITVPKPAGSGSVSYEEIKIQDLYKKITK